MFIQNLRSVIIIISIKHFVDIKIVYKINFIVLTMAQAKKLLQIYIFYELDLLFTMVNRFYNNKLPRRITEICYHLCKVFLKLHKTESNIDLIRKAIYNQVMPNFVKVQGYFPWEELHKETECKLLYEHLSKHYQDLKELHEKALPIL